MIADGHSMRMPPEVVKHLGRSAECGFRVDNLIFLEERIDKSGKATWILHFGDRSRKGELSLPIRPSQVIDELGAKDGTEHVHRQEEGGFWVNPAFMVRGESAGWNQAMDIRMDLQVLSPSMRCLFAGVRQPIDGQRGSESCALVLWAFRERAPRSESGGEAENCE